MKTAQWTSQNTASFTDINISGLITGLVEYEISQFLLCTWECADQKNKNKQARKWSSPTQQKNKV